MSMVKFVYFDIGGVLLFDFSGSNKWQKMKQDLGVTEHNEEAFNNVWQQHRNAICVDCDVDTLLPKIAAVPGVTFARDYSMLDDFVDRFEPNGGMWEIAQQAHKQFRIGLLTNMYPRMLDKIRQAQLIPDLPWDAVIDSSTVRAQKPDERIFQIAQQQAGVNPDEIFFIDNSLKNVEAAQAFGWQAVLYDPQDTEASNALLIESLGLEKRHS